MRHIGRFLRDALFYTLSLVVGVVFIFLAIAAFVHTPLWDQTPAPVNTPVRGIQTPCPDMSLYHGTCSK